MTWLPCRLSPVLIRSSLIGNEHSKVDAHGLTNFKRVRTQAGWETKNVKKHSYVSAYWQKMHIFTLSLFSESS